jgi:hypothetical protein
MVSISLEARIDLITQAMMMLMTRQWQNEATQKMEPSLSMEAGQDGGGMQGTIILTITCFILPRLSKSMME